MAEGRRIPVAVRRETENFVFMMPNGKWQVEEEEMGLILEFPLLLFF